MMTLAAEPATTPAKHPTALLRSERFLGHQTGTHPENPGRLQAVEDELRRQNLLTGRPNIPFDEATRDQLSRIHDPSYLDALEHVTTAGGAALDPDTLVLPDSLSVARLAAGAAVAATNGVLDGQARRAFCLGRPPGHHATPSRGMGFCLLNTAAVAAAGALARGLDRVLIVDWDVHHGNGTQDAFYATDRVLYCSIHQSPLYPGTGAADETGIGAGADCTLNVPVHPGAGDETYVRLFDDVMLPRAREYQPQLILVSAGFDAHAADPLAGVRLTEAGFATLASRLAALADDECGGRLVAVLEGGYHPRALARSVASVLEVFDTIAAPAEPTGRTRPVNAPEKR